MALVNTETSRPRERVPLGRKSPRPTSPKPRLGPLAGLEGLARAAVREGDLEIRMPGGKVLKLGDGTGQPVRIAMSDLRWCARIAANPQLALGEAYMEEGLTFEEGDIHDLIDLLGRNSRYRRQQKAEGLARVWRDHRLQANDRQNARRNVAHHYDLSIELYRRFLDEDLQYSCAYFREPDMSLEAAQLAKKRHLAAKLALEPGMKVLDIGCGFGGLALNFAETDGVEVDGITLSTEQLGVAQARAREKGLSDRAQFSLTDYRDVEGPYDRIVSVGMFEHVGRPNFQAYFDQVARLLKDDGVAVIHTIGRPDGPGFTQPWVAKYIFPGGYIPALSEVAAAIEPTGLMITDVEILRLHYAETLRCWRERFQARREEIAGLYDERFCRMWEFYLSVSEAAFRHHRHSVFQIQLTKRVDVLPLTRDYISAADRRAPSTSSDRA